MDRCTTKDGGVRDDPSCQCDMGVGGWFLNRDRIGKVDFLPPFALDGISVITRIDQTSSSVSKGAFFITVFSLSVWGLILALVVVFALLKMLDVRFAPPDDSYRPLPDSESCIRRLKHYILKSRLLRRMRRAVQSTCTFLVKTYSH